MACRHCSTSRHIIILLQYHTPLPTCIYLNYRCRLRSIAIKVCRTQHREFAGTWICMHVSAELHSVTHQMLLILQDVVKNAISKYKGHRAKRTIIIL